MIVLISCTRFESRPYLVIYSWYFVVYDSAQPRTVTHALNCDTIHAINHVMEKDDLHLASHQMEIFFRVTGTCAGNSPVTGEFPVVRPVTRSFDVSLICAWINGWVNSREAGDLRRNRAHYDVILMVQITLLITIFQLCINPNIIIRMQFLKHITFYETPQILRIPPHMVHFCVYPDNHYDYSEPKLCIPTHCKRNSYMSTTYTRMTGVQSLCCMCLFTPKWYTCRAMDHHSYEIKTNFPSNLNYS